MFVGFEKQATRSVKQATLEECKRKKRGAGEVIGRLPMFLGEVHFSIQSVFCATDT